jgi:hypothetical protein
MRQVWRTSGAGLAVRGLWFCASLAAATLLTGCSTAQTVVVVSVSGQVEGITQLVVKLSAGGLATTIYVPEMPAPITLPTDFTIEMDRSRTGELIIDINANNSDAQKVASGSASIADVVVGERNEIAVELIATMPPAPGGDDAGIENDGGVDSAVADDAGDAGIDNVVSDDAGEADADAGLSEDTSL